MHLLPVVLAEVKVEVWYVDMQVVARWFGECNRHIPVAVQGEGVGYSWVAPLVGHLPE